MSVSIYSQKDNYYTIIQRYCMSGTAMNNVLSNGNHTNDNNTTVPSSSLSVDAVAIAVALPGVPHVWYLIGRHDNKQ